MEKIIIRNVWRDPNGKDHYLVFSDAYPTDKDYVLDWLQSAVNPAFNENLALEEWMDLAVLMAFTDAPSRKGETSSALLKWANNSGFKEFVISKIDADALSSFADQVRRVVEGFTNIDLAAMKQAMSII